MSHSTYFDNGVGKSRRKPERTNNSMIPEDDSARSEEKFVTAFDSIIDESLKEASTATPLKPSPAHPHYNAHNPSDPHDPYLEPDD